MIMGDEHMTVHYICIVYRKAELKAISLNTNICSAKGRQQTACSLARSNYDSSIIRVCLD